MAYYFLGKYNRAKAEKSLLKNGYRKEYDRDYGFIQYVSKDDNFLINLTSASEGRLGIQGDGPDDIYERGRKSKHYSGLKNLVEILNHEKKLVDGGFNKPFPELQ
jgi:hypothetical protein